MIGKPNNRRHYLNETYKWVYVDLCEYVLNPLMLFTGILSLRSCYYTGIV